MPESRKMAVPAITNEVTGSFNQLITLTLFAMTFFIKQNGIHYFSLVSASRADWAVADQGALMQPAEL
jgi:hypothetical protein